MRARFVIVLAQNLILAYDHLGDRWTEAGTVIPYRERGICGTSASFTWSHRGLSRTESMAFLAGGYAGTDWLSRFYVR